MEIIISTKLKLKILYILAWIVFIGLCIEAGGFIFNTLFTLFFNPIGANYFWKEIDLSDLYKFDSGYFCVIGFLMSLVTILKAILFYLIVKLLHDKKLNLSQPFTLGFKRFIILAAYLSLGIGLFSFWGAKHVEWFVAHGVKMPGIQILKFGSADVWFFMAIILYVIAQIFKKGIEIQTENELTI